MLRQEAEDEEVLQQTQVRRGGQAEELQLGVAVAVLEPEVVGDAVLEVQAWGYG